MCLFSSLLPAGFPKLFSQGVSNPWRQTGEKHRTVRLMRLLVLLCLLSACNAALPVDTPEVTPESTPRIALQASNTPSARLSATPFIWPTLPPSPTPVCPDAPRTRLIVQERGRVLPDDPRPVNVRQQPGTDQPVKALLPVRAVFYVLEGPVCKNSYSWFRIRYDGAEGWIAEGDLTSYYVEPYLPG